MPDNETNEIDKAGRVLSAANAGAIQGAVNAMVDANNKLVQVLETAGIPEAAKDEAPADDTVPDEAAADDSAPQEKSVWRPSQEEVNYVAVSTTAGEACANCRWFTGVQGLESCHIISNWPLDILPTGYCDRHETILLADIMPPAPMSEAPAVMEMESKAAAPIIEPPQEQRTIRQRVQDIARQITNLRKDADKEDEQFIVYKDAAGKDRWFARYTNNAEDFDGEIFTEKAHDKYIARLVARLIPMPELWFWHKKGTRHGQADMVVRDGHVVMAVGHFDDTPFAQKLIRYYRKNRGRIKLSHGSIVPLWARLFDKAIRRRLFTDYNTVEITTLPPRLAKPAALFTSFDEEIPMAFEKETRELFVQIVGEEDTARIERENDSINKSIDDNLVFKDFADLVTSKEERTPDTNVNSPVVPLVADLITAQAYLVKVAEGVAMKQTETDQQLVEIAASNKALIATVEALQKQLGQPPVRASEAVETLVSETEKQAIIEKQPVEYDPAFPGMKVPLRPVSPL